MESMADYPSAIWWLAAALLAAAAVVCLLRIYDPATSGIFPPCPGALSDGLVLSGMRIAARDASTSSWKFAGGMGDESADRASAAVS